MSTHGFESRAQVRRAVRAALLLAPAFAAAPFALAQDRAASAAALEEVVVTARKAEEKLTEVPLAIAAYSSADLAKRNVTSLSDIAQYTAGFSFESYAGATTPAPLIRGLTQNALTDRNQNVGTFVDGVHVQQQGNIDFSMMDLERIEIVKGPQNAQYGRSSFAGAINWVPKKPVLGEWDGSAALTVGTDERFDVSGSVSIPLWGDKLAVRIAGKQTEFDGTWKNNSPYGDRAIPTTTFGYTFKGTDGNLGGYNNEARQIALRFQPIEALTIDAMYYRSTTENDFGYNVSIQPRAAAQVPALGANNPLNCSPRITASFSIAAGGNQLYCGELNMTAKDVQGDPRATGTYTHSDLTTGRIEYKFNDNFSATYVYGRGTYDSANYGPSPNLPAIVQFGDATAPQPVTGRPSIQVAASPFTDQQAESHELRVDGKISSVSWRVGYYTSDVTDIGAAALLERRLPLALDPTGQVNFGQFPFSATISTFTDETEAFFGSVSVPIGDAWTLEAEGRQAKETRKQLPLNRTTEFTEFTPRVNLKWQPQAGWMFYGSVARGTKAGGFNGVTADVFTFEPEENTTFELGAKQSLLEDRLQLNYSVFLIDWKDLQLSVPDTIPSRPGVQDANYVGNVSGAQAKGLELEAVFLASERVRLNFAGSYVESTFDNDVIDTTFGRLCETNGAAACVFLPRSATLPLGGSPIGGNDLPRTPRTKLSFGAEYFAPVGSMELSLRGDYNYQSKYYIENLNLGVIPERGLLNLSATLSGADGDWSASVWAKNTLNEEYVSSSFAVSVVNQYGPGLGEGRTMGVTLRYAF